MADKREALRALITKATDVTEADLMRYEHGGGRWAKLRDGERTLVADFYNEADREAHVAAWLALPGLLKAADEITRLNAENEELVGALEPFARGDHGIDDIRRARALICRVKGITPATEPSPKVPKVTHG